MREILFRAKSITSGKWIESMTIARGTIKRKMNDYFIEDNNGEWKGVYHETIGQYTGLKDKNSKMIFEGDLFKIGAEKETFEVVYESGCFLAYCNGKQYGLLGELMICFVEIIGNIHDNPELITNPK